MRWMVGQCSASLLREWKQTDNNVYQSVTVFLEEDFRTGKVNGKFRELDAGFDFYAPQSFAAEDGRRIQIGWMGMPDAEEYYTNVDGLATS